MQCSCREMYSESNRSNEPHKEWSNYTAVRFFSGSKCKKKIKKSAKEHFSNVNVCLLHVLSTGSGLQWNVLSLWVKHKSELGNLDTNVSGCNPPCTDTSVGSPFHCLFAHTKCCLFLWRKLVHLYPGLPGLPSSDSSNREWNTTGSHSRVCCMSLKRTQLEIMVLTGIQ